MLHLLTSLYASPLRMRRRNVYDKHHTFWKLVEPDTNRTAALWFLSSIVNCSRFSLSSLMTAVTGGEGKGRLGGRGWAGGEKRDLISAIYKIPILATTTPHSLLHYNFSLNSVDLRIPARMPRTSSYWFFSCRLYLLD